MKQKTALIAVAISLGVALIAAIVAIALLLSMRAPKTEKASDLSSQLLAADIEVLMGPFGDVEEESVGEDMVVPLLPPAPVVIGEKGARNLQRVEFNPPIGEIFRIYYDRPWNVLLMAVVEPSGLRSIWRLDKDLKLTRVLDENGRPGEIFLGADSLGRIYAGFADPGTLYRTADLGRHWEKVATGIDGAFWGIADNGKGTVWGSLHSWNKALLYRSIDDGFTWEIWKDFQMEFPEHTYRYAMGDDRLALRHLHDVAYLNDRLFVGTGDIARFTVMSEDMGDTWKEVWSEGFTASVPLEDNSGLLMGPDRLQSHGIALYDLLAIEPLKCGILFHTDMPATPIV